MEHELTMSLYVHAIDGGDQCPECGHLWSDIGLAHYHDCRYFFVDGDSEEDECFFEEVAEPRHSPMMKTAA